MTSALEIYRVLRNDFTAFAASLSPAIQVGYPNEPFDPPAGEVFFRFNIVDGESDIIAMTGNGNLYRTTALLVIQIFGPKGSGEGYQRSLANLIVQEYSGTKKSGASLLSGYPQNLGVTDEGYNQMNVVVPFRYDFTK